MARCRSSAKARSRGTHEELGRSRYVTAGQAELMRADLEQRARRVDRQTNGFADETRDEGCCRMVEDLVGRADLFDVPKIEDRDAVRELQRLLLIVGDEQGRVAGPVVDLAQPAPQVAPHLGVERAERLVEQQHARLDGEGAGQRNTLALTAGKLGGKAFAEACELHQFEQVANAAADLGVGWPRGARPHTQPVSNILRHVKMAEEGVVLETRSRRGGRAPTVWWRLRCRTECGQPSGSPARPPAAGTSSCPSPTDRAVPAARLASPRGRGCGRPPCR
jgi:hypothetical protein